MSGNDRPSDSRPVLPKHLASNRVWREDWRPLDKLVAFCIINHFFGGKNSSYPSQRRIADQCGVAERTVGNCLVRLVNGDPARGLLPLFTKERRRGRGNLYTFVGHPESLLKGREAHSQLVQALERSIDEPMSDRELRDMGVCNEDIARMRDQWQLRRELDVARMREQLGQDDYDRQVRQLEIEGRKLARKVASRGRKRPAPDADEPSGDG